MGRVFIDRFSAGLDDLTIREGADPAVVLKVLDRTKRFSCFEASANQTIAGTVTMLFKRGYVTDLGGGYPWTKVALTDSGRALIADAERATQGAHHE